MSQRTPISLIAGTLGSGKTTLLKNILDNTDKRIAVLMNEFGEIAIDSEVIRGENIDIVELAGGCVCCSMTGEFEAAIIEMIEKIAPELIVVETTGVAEADALVFEVEDNLPMVRLDSVICIVDAYMSVRFPRIGYTERTQMQAADILLINKTDLVTPEEVKEVIRQVREHNNRGHVFETVKCDVDVDTLFGFNGERAVSVTVNPIGPKFSSFTFRSEKIMDREKFQRLVESLPLSVYRAKGFVRFSGGTCLFNYIIGRPEFDDYPAGKTSLVFIGQNLDDEKDTILEELKACEV